MSAFIHFLLTYTKEEKSGRILFLESAADSFAKLQQAIQRLLVVIPFAFIYGGSHGVKFHIEDSVNSVGGFLIIFC